MRVRSAVLAAFDRGSSSNAYLPACAGVDLSACALRAMLIGAASADLPAGPLLGPLALICKVPPSTRLGCGHRHHVSSAAIGQALRDFPLETVLTLVAPLLWTSCTPTTI